MPDFPCICAGCGGTFTEGGSVWEESVNLIPDALVVEHSNFMHGEDIVEADVAFDWCGLVCFCRWAYRAAAHMGARPRP